MLDTGGWLSWGCPFSKRAMPEIKGSIYRIQRKDISVRDDPRGLMLSWNSLNDKDLIYLINDSRPAVRDKAVETIIGRGEAILDLMSKLILESSVSI